MCYVSEGDNLPPTALPKQVPPPYHNSDVLVNTVTYNVGPPPTDVGVADCCLAVSEGNCQPMTDCYHTLCKDLTGCMETSSQLT